MGYGDYIPEEKKEINIITNAKNNAKVDDKNNFKDGTNNATIPYKAPPSDPVKSRPLGSSIINDFESWKSTLSTNTKTEANTFLPRQRTGTSSYINEYAFISYGGDYFSGNTPANTFASGEMLQGFVSTPEEWKNPTAKNIIEWSRKLSKDRKINSGYDVNNASTGDDGIYEKTGENKGNYKQTIDVTTERKTNTGVGGAVSFDNINAGKASDNQNLPAGDKDKSELTIGNINSDTASTNLSTNTAQEQGNKIAGAYGSGGSIQGVGNFKYDWKDFSFCKNYGKIPNNRLLTLRRFKLPVLDNGVVSAKEEIVSRISDNLLNPGQSKSDYISSDSARALTYFGDGTGNTLDSIFGFTVGLAWAPETTSAGNPDYNTGISGGDNNFLTNPIDGLTLLNKANLGTGDDVKNRLLTAAAIQLQPGIGLADNEKLKNAVYNSLENDPFKNGWQYNVYGPINVLLKTNRRARGLNFTGGSISLTFEYDLTQVGTLNPKMALIDIIANMYSLCYNSGSFWGGDYRFKRESMNIPLPDDLRDALERVSNGSTADYNKILSDITTKMYQKIEDIGEMVKNGNSSQVIKDIFNAEGLSLSEDEQKEYNDLGGNLNGPSPSPDNQKRLDELRNKKAGFDNNFLTNILGKIKDPTFLAQLGSSNEGRNITRIVVNTLMGNKSDIKSLSGNLLRVKPLMTGEPVGEWHLTVGNPMNPIAVIGNLICTGMKMSMSDELGVDDFPTSLKFTVALDHGRDRDKGDIESMFNMGQGRFYLNIIGRQPWETGFSVGNSFNNTGSVSNAQAQGNKINQNGTITKS